MCGRSTVEVKMKIIRVGDPHAKVSNLKEMKDLVLFIAQTAKDHKADRIEILGDLFHTHAVLRLEVLEFWTWALDFLNEVCETIVLVGNHDLSGDYSSSTSALTVFSLMRKKHLIIIEEPTIIGVFGYVPYTHDHSTFIDRASALADMGARVLICHQTIQGSKYDNGMYAPDGIPTGSWSESFSHVISGHIHAEQEFSNIIYPGTARWDGLADANKRKGIWVFTHESDTGQIVEKQFITTEKVCNPIQCIEWKEGNPEPTKWEENVKMAIELVGSSAWVSQQKALLKGKCSIKTKITDVKKSEKRNAGKGLEDFLSNLFVSTLDKDNLIKLAREYGIL